MRLARGRWVQLVIPAVIVTAALARFSGVAAIWAAVMSVWLSITTWKNLCKWMDED